VILNESGALCEGIVISNGMGWWIYPTIFGVRIAIGDPTPPLMAFDECFCYCDFTRAYEAISRWDGTGEPLGWHRHPPTGRRRPDGDPDKEYVRT
jgi:hypothetical protein